MTWFREKLTYIGNWCAFEVARWSARLLPPRFLFSICNAVADLGFYLLHKPRKRLIDNLSLALGQRLDKREIEIVVHKCVRNLCRNFIELALAMESFPDKIRAEIPLIGREHLEAALTKGKGIIALSAHLGNFLLVGTRLAAEGYPVYLLVNESPGPLRELRDRYRLEIGLRTIYARPRKQAAHELSKVLRENGIAIVIADEYRSGSGVHVPFFGRTVLARRGPATLALRSVATMLPLYLIRDANKKLKLIIEPEMKLSRSGSIPADVKENTRCVTQWVERVVRAYPDQWNWLSVHWQEASPGPVAEDQGRYEGVA